MSDKLEGTRSHWQQEDDAWRLTSDRTQYGLTENTHAQCRKCREWIFREYTKTHLCYVPERDDERSPTSAVLGAVRATEEEVVGTILGTDKREETCGG